MLVYARWKCFVLLRNSDFSYYIKTLFRSLLNQDIENQQKTSLEYDVITQSLHQNERNRAFVMLVAETGVNAMQVCFVDLMLLFIAS